MKITRHTLFLTLAFVSSLFFFSNVSTVSALNYFYPNSSSVVSGSSTFLNWDISDECSSPNSWATPSNSNWQGTRTDSGSKSTGPLTSSTVFFLDCGFGLDVYEVTVNVTSANPTASISASLNPINAGETTTITWGSTNSTSCTASGGASGWSGAKATSGTQNFDLYSNTTFTITCTDGSTNSTPASVTVSVNPFTSLLSVTAGGTSSSIALAGGTRANPISTTASTAQFELTPSGVSNSDWLCVSSSYSSSSWSPAQYGPYNIKVSQNPNTPPNQLWNQSLIPGYYDFLVAYSAESAGSSCEAVYLSAFIRLNVTSPTGTINISQFPVSGGTWRLTGPTATTDTQTQYTNLSPGTYTLTCLTAPATYTCDTPSPSSQIVSAGGNYNMTVN